MTITATLIRGGMYALILPETYNEQTRGYESKVFKAKTPVVVTEAEAEKLEKLTAPVKDGDGIIIEKPRFYIDYNAEDAAEVEPSIRTNPSLTSKGGTKGPATAPGIRGRRPAVKV